MTAISRTVQARRANCPTAAIVDLPRLPCGIITFDAIKHANKVLGDKADIPPPKIELEELTYDLCSRNTVSTKPRTTR